MVVTMALVPLVIGVGLMSECRYRIDDSAQMHRLLTAVKIYRLQHGVYPTTFEELTEGPEPLLWQTPVDHHGRAYLLGYRTVAGGREVPVIRARGDDGWWFTGDDDVVW